MRRELEQCVGVTGRGHADGIEARELTRVAPVLARAAPGSAATHPRARGRAGGARRGSRASRPIRWPTRRPATAPACGENVVEDRCQDAAVTDVTTQPTELMPAAVYIGDGRLEVQQVAMPELAPGDVLVEISHCGVCGTDLHL